MHKELAVIVMERIGVFLKKLRVEQGMTARQVA
jgi:hypothetical protein